MLLEERNITYNKWGMASTESMEMEREWKAYFDRHELKILMSKYNVRMDLEK